MNPRGDAGGARPAPSGWRIVLALALIGAALGFGWGIADQPLYRATATVAVESDSQGSDEARLERFAQRGESEEVGRRAAGLLGNDVPGADLLADVSVRPSPRGGFVIVTATAAAPDVAVAAADGFQRALVGVEGKPLALGEAASIPTEPTGGRPAGLWAGIGFLAGLLVGLIVVALLRLKRRRVAGAEPMRPVSPAAPEVDPRHAFADRVGAGVLGFDPGPAGAVVRDGAGAVMIPPTAVADVGMLADRLGIRSGTAPCSIAVTGVGGSADIPGVSAALAVAATGAGRRVILVEADLADAMLADRLGIEPAPGLHDHLGGLASPREVLRSVGTPEANGDGFAFVPAGTGGAGASVAGPRFAALVDRLARVYDVVIYSTPPLLESEDADAIAALVDVLAVLVGPDTGGADLDQAADLLHGAPVGVVAGASG